MFWCHLYRNVPTSTMSSCRLYNLVLVPGTINKENNHPPRINLGKVRAKHAYSRVTSCTCATTSSHPLCQRVKPGKYEFVVCPLFSVHTGHCLPKRNVSFKCTRRIPEVFSLLMFLAFWGYFLWAYRSSSSDLQHRRKTGNRERCRSSSTDIPVFRNVVIVAHLAINGLLITKVRVSSRRGGARDHEVNAAVVGTRWH